MSNEYTPDNWVILKIKYAEDKPFYKVLGGWSGGYATGDSWRMNSGIKEIIESKDTYRIVGESGSVYICRKNSEQIRMNISGVLSSLNKEHGDKVLIVTVEEVIDALRS